jgi:preprotein translocase subunit SecE
VAEKILKAKQPDKPENVKVVAPKAKTTDREKEKPKQPNAIVRFWRETVGELRKVAWPTRQEAIRLTGIVLAVMGGMAVVLGLLDFVFSQLIALLVK